MQSMYDLVGDKIHEIFDAQVVDIGLFDPRQEPSITRTRSNAASASRTNRRASMDFGKIVLESRAPILVNDVEA